MIGGTDAVYVCQLLAESSLLVKINEGPFSLIFSLTEIATQGRVMIDRVETLNIINVCSFFKLTSDTSVRIVQSTT